MKNQSDKSSKMKDENNELSFSWFKFLFKTLILFSAVLAVVLYTDYKGIFNAEQRNNHIKRKWTSFYDFVDQKEIDVLILGNSHIITGVDPFVLSNATSTNCFILGNSGTNILDVWFQLGGALNHAKPKLVVIETYCINDGELPADDALVPYLQSFESQNDSWYKLRTMPKLFQTDQWVKAWSPTIRNHSFLLTDTARINYNLKHPNLPKSKKLDLGRFARFATGIQDSTLAKYDSLGAPVNGHDFKISSFTKKYLAKIMNMCHENGIQVMFLTVPMYHKHVSNYRQWRSVLNNELKKYPAARWLDLQASYDTLVYTPDKFENTYAQNQHLSNLGMVVTAYKLAAFLDRNYAALLPNRSNERKWLEDFRPTDHFVYNQPIESGRAGFISITQDTTIGKKHVNELVIQEFKASNQLLLKLENPATSKDSIQVTYNFVIGDKKFTSAIQMYRLKNIIPIKNTIFVANLLKSVEVDKIVSIDY